MGKRTIGRTTAQVTGKKNRAAQQASAQPPPEVATPPDVVDSAPPATTAAETATQDTAQTTVTTPPDPTAAGEAAAADVQALGAPDNPGPATFTPVRIDAGKPPVALGIRVLMGVVMYNDARGNTRSVKSVPGWRTVVTITQEPPPKA